MNKESMSFWRDIMSYIGDEIERNHINHYGQQIAGFYTRPKAIQKVFS